MMDETTVVGVERFDLGEGGRWLEDKLVFVDIYTGRLLLHDPLLVGSIQELARVECTLGCVAPVRGQQEMWIAAAGPGLAILRADGGLTWIARPEEGRPGAMRMNDGAAHPSGSFYVGSMAEDFRAGAGRLYCMDRHGSVSIVLDGLTIPNGPAFDSAGRIAYLADSAERTIWKFDVDQKSGVFRDRRQLCRFKEGKAVPDGMAVDADGCLWIAMWAGSKIVRLAASGEIEQEIPLPCAQPTSVCLAPETSKWKGTLWVTSATRGMDHKGTADGALLAVATDAYGVPPASVDLAL